MDNDYSADFEDILESIRDSDVLLLTFVSVGERLLLDFRACERCGPLVRVVPRARTVAERMRTLRTWRPHLPDSEMVVMGWPSFVRTMASSGLLDAIAERIEATGHENSLRDLHRSYRMLAMLEDSMQRKAVRGHGFRTLWSATPAPR